MQGDLLQIAKPAQYIGGERNSALKSEKEISTHIALGFPDAYEVGMSHLGLQILYDILNKEKDIWAERVYTPLPDMEALLRKKGVPLCSLESKRPLADFDVLGFSLQYELCGTNILLMLELAEIPRYSRDRTASHPIVIGGGPYSYHPEPLADFFDAFLLGDAEEAVVEIARVVSTGRKAGLSRTEILRQLAQLTGVYVPSFFSPQYDASGQLLEIKADTAIAPVVTKRVLPTMEGAPYPVRPVIPNITTVHNRLSIEVMRGCVRGCRFCQAGYLYRPQRERSPQEILSLVRQSLPETGYEELSLLSLSTADYCSIVPLLKTMMDEYGEGDKLAISFPSTRVDALKPEILEQVQRVRRTGFTVAPEGGSQRLRDVINKGVTDEEILETAKNVFSMGWSGIKLYFMIGLPTETDEDLLGIVDIATRIRALPEARGNDITVNVSTLVPKPHTPFQWAEQILPEETVRRQRLLAYHLQRTKVNFRYHNSFSTYLEGVFARGDRKLSAVIERAYTLGCRLDAWDEYLKKDLWLQAFSDCDIRPEDYLRARDTAETLPWDHLSCGIPKPYFLKEWERAIKEKETADCLTTSCSICNVCDYDKTKNILWPREESESKLPILNKTFREESAQTALSSPELPKVSSEVMRPQEISAAGQVIQEAVCRLRITFSKNGPYRYIGHLETMKAMERAMRRADIPLVYSAGFHPKPKVAFGPPSQLGVFSRAEFADLMLLENVDGQNLIERLNAEFPPGLSVTECKEIPLRAPGIQESIVFERWQLRLLKEPLSTDLPLGFLGSLGGSLSEWTNELTNGSTNGSTSVTGRETLADEFKDRMLSCQVIRQRPAKKRHQPPREVLLPFAESLSGLCLRPLVNKSTDVPFFAETAVEFEITHSSRATLRPVEIAEAWTGLALGEYELEKLACQLREEGN